MVVLNPAIDFKNSANVGKEYKKSDYKENGFKDVYSRVTNDYKKSVKIKAEKKSEHVSSKDKCIKNNDEEELNTKNNIIHNNQIEESLSETENKPNNPKPEEIKQTNEAVNSSNEEEKVEALDKMIEELKNTLNDCSNTEKLAEKIKDLVKKTEKINLSNPDKLEFLEKVQNILDNNIPVNKELKIAHQLLNDAINTIKQAEEVNESVNRVIIDKDSENVSKVSSKEVKEALNETEGKTNKEVNNVQKTKENSGYSDDRNSKDDSNQESNNKIKVTDMRSSQIETNNEKVVDFQNIIQNSSNTEEKFITNDYKVMSQPQESKNVFKQVVETIDVTLKDGKTEMSVNLKPDHLGKLNFEMISEKGIIVAKFTAESQQVKEIIESNLPALKDALEEKGISVQGFSVSVGDNSADERQKAFASFKNNKKVKLKNHAGSSSQLIETENISYSNNEYGVYESSVNFTA